MSTKNNTTIIDMEERAKRADYADVDKYVREKNCANDQPCPYSPRCNRPWTGMECDGGAELSRDYEGR